MAKNRFAYNEVGAGMKPNVNAKGSCEPARPGKRSRIAGDSGPAVGEAARPGFRQKAPKGGGTPPRVARPGGAQRASGRSR